MLRALLSQLLSRGTSADRQRRILAETGSLLDVVRDGARLTAGNAGEIQQAIDRVLRLLAKTAERL